MERTGKRVLLVEDERDQALLLQAELERCCPAQFELEWTQSLQAALEAIRREPFDAILLDLSLPDSLGLETVEKVSAASHVTPIVVLSGQNDEHVAVEAVRKGAQDYLIKDEANGRFIARAIRYSIERKQAEELLRQANDELERRVRDRTAELTRIVETLQGEMNRRSTAERALRARSEQLRLLASELTLAEQRERQRLALVIHDGLQQLLVAANYRLGRLERAENREVRQAATEVGQLISDSIEASRSLTSELGPPILRVGRLIPALEWLVRWMQDKHGLAVDMEAHGNVEPEAEDMTVLLFQATRELLFNVVKHAEVKAARVQVALVDGQVQITVTDKGVGFDPRQLRAEGAPSGGFGLFSIKERLDLMGGRVEIDSAPGRGSRFKLVAPLPSLGPEAVQRADQRPRVSVGMAGAREIGRVRAEGRIRVMLVDDHVVMRQGLAALLQEEPDIEIVGEASDGKSAVDLAREVRPDVVLMDVSMPGMNGIEATRIIHAENPRVRVIGLSMFEEADQAAAMRQAGAVDYLNKTGPSNAVIMTIRARIGPPGSQTEGERARPESRMEGAGKDAQSDGGAL